MSLVAMSMMAAVLVTTTAVSTVTAAAANNGSLVFSIGSPSSILYGQDVTYTLMASNPSGPTDGFNLSWRVVLSAGASFVSSSAGNPTTYPDSPIVGETTLVFANTDDLQIGVTRTLDVTINPDVVAYPVGSSVSVSAGAYMSGSVRLIPDFDANGAHVDNGDTNAFATSASTTRVEAIEPTKVEPNSEAELLRGVHNEWTPYSLTVQNNYVNPTGSVVAAVCVTPDAVTTESLAAGAIKPGSPAGVYTHVMWNLTDTATDPLFGVAMTPAFASTPRQRPTTARPLRSAFRRRTSTPR